MNKIVKIALFSFAMILGMNTLQAQTLKVDNTSPEVIAKTKTAELNSTLGLTGTQQRAVYRAMVVKENNYKKYINGKDISSPDVKAAVKKHDEVFDAAMKKALTPEQYKKWKSLN